MKRSTQIIIRDAAASILLSCTILLPIYGGIELYIHLSHTGRCVFLIMLSIIGLSCVIFIATHKSPSIHDKQ